MKIARNSIIEPEELNSLLKSGESVSILDASYTAQPVYKQAHIQGAQYFDIDDIADPEADMAHMLPSAAVFSDKVSALGVSNDHIIVIYDQFGIHMAASRAWWMFRTFGHKKVYVLNGGLQAWSSAGFVLSNQHENKGSSTYKAAFRPELVVSHEDILNNIKQPQCTVIDVRSPERFSGSALENNGYNAGHMPNAKNLFFMDLINQENGTLKAPEGLQPLIAPYKDIDKLIISCGSGVTACVLALALYDVYQKDVAVYDGSWTEWGQAALNLPYEAA